MEVLTIVEFRRDTIHQLGSTHGSSEQVKVAPMREVGEKCGCWPCPRSRNGRPIPAQIQRHAPAQSSKPGQRLNRTTTASGQRIDNIAPALGDAPAPSPLLVLTREPVRQPKPLPVRPFTLVRSVRDSYPPAIIPVLSVSSLARHGERKQG